MLELAIPLPVLEVAVSGILSRLLLKVSLEIETALRLELLDFLWQNGACSNSPAFRLLFFAFLEVLVGVVLLAEVLLAEVLLKATLGIVGLELLDLFLALSEDILFDVNLRTSIINSTSHIRT